MRPVLSDIQNIIVTSSIAFVTGYVFQIFGLPAPFLLGSLFGVWIIAGIIPPIRSRVGIPRWVFVPVILGLGTLIGANFRPYRIVRHYRCRHVPGHDFGNACWSFLFNANPQI